MGVGFGKLGSKTSDFSAAREIAASSTAVIQITLFSEDRFRKRQPSGRMSEKCTSTPDLIAKRFDWSDKSTRAFLWPILLVPF
jgi:hypothetical protein